MAVRWIEDVEEGEERNVGKKAGNLAILSQHGLQVPRGFVVTAPTFEEFVRQNGLENQIESILNNVDRSDINSVQRATNRIKNLILGADITESVREEIEEAYEKINLSEEVRNAGGEAVNLVGGQRETEFVAVRSSPTGTLIPGAHVNELNVNGKSSVVRKVKECWASLYSAEALSVEEQTGNIHSMAVVVQRMVEPDVSGSIYSANPVQQDGQNAYMIEALWGLGSALYDGSSTPDKFVLEDTGTVREEDIANKEWKIVRDPTSGKNIKQRVAQEERDSRCLDTGQRDRLVDAIRKVENRFGRNVRLDFVLGRNRLHILDIQQFSSVTAEQEKRNQEVFLAGRGASAGDAQGTAKIIYSDTDIETVSEEELLVSVNASERLIPALNNVNGYISDKGGVSSNLATLARQLDVPCIVGTGKATDMITNGEEVTIFGASGNIVEGSVQQASAQQTLGTPQSEPSTASNALNDALTATHVKVIGTAGVEHAEGAIITDYTDYSTAYDAASTYHPETVWVQTQGMNTSHVDNIGELASQHTGDVAGKGIILSTYGGVMRTRNLFDRGVKFVGLDIDALKQDGDQESLLNSVEKLGEETVTGCECALLMENVDRTLIEKAVESGIDSIAVPEDKVKQAKNTVAKAEKRFMLQKLRDL